MSPPEYSNAVRQLMVLMLISLIGTAGIALPYPVLAPYFVDASNPLTTFAGLPAKILLGLLLAAYPLGLLLGGMVIGALSDRFGRKPVLVQTLLLSVAGYLLTAWGFYAQNYPVVLLARLLTGLCEGNIATARAMALDLHPHIERKRALALLYATTYGGWLVGPLAGGYLMDWGADMTFVVAAAAVLVACLLAQLSLPSNPAQLASHPVHKQNIFKEHSFALLRQPQIAKLSLYYAVYTLGINTYYEFYPLWLAEQHQFSSRAIGWATVMITTLMIVASASIVHWLPRHLGDRVTLLLGSIGLALCIGIATLLSVPQLYLALALSGGFIAIINTIYPSMMSQHYGHLGEGRVMGLQVSLFCLTNIIMALLGSWVAVLGSSYTMLLAATLILASMFLFRMPQAQPPAQEAPG